MSKTEVSVTAFRSSGYRLHSGARYWDFLFWDFIYFSSNSKKWAWTILKFPHFNIDRSSWFWLDHSHNGSSDPSTASIDLKENESPEVTTGWGERRRMKAVQQGHMLVLSASLSRCEVSCCVGHPNGHKSSLSKQALSSMPEVRWMACSLAYFSKSLEVWVLAGGE